MEGQTSAGPVGSFDPARAQHELDGTGYRFVRAIDASEAGVVWEVEHANLGVHYVMKLLAARLTDDPHRLDRFRVEAQVMARLQHDNLLRVIDFGWTAADRPFLVTELLSGQTLAELASRQGALAVGDALELIRQALMGLGEAHRAGLVHRDVTLANLFVCNPSEQGDRVVKVMDFGLAKVLAAGAAAPSYAPVLSTKLGAVGAGTSAISPEQAEGRAVDPRTDLYGAGLALYELIAGRGPFVCTSEAEYALAHAKSAPPPPSEVASQTIGAELDAIVLKALRKQPADRYASADEMADVLEDYAGRLARAPASVDAQQAPPARALARGTEPAATSRPEVARPASRSEVATTAAIRDGATSPPPPEAATSRGSGLGSNGSNASLGPARARALRIVARPPSPEGFLASDGAIFQPGASCGADRYRIVGLLSCGGFAEIYEARDVRDEAPRAIKVLQARHQGNELAMARLLREARAGISLSHPNLVRIYDAGIDARSGALYVAMERLEGRTLRDVLVARRRLEPLVALQWAAELADAVHVLNELGIIHRDLKPENIFVTADGVLKVLDLGNIRIERVGLKTTCGPITGTALYMSPEHIRGEKVDRRADVYALSLITYECLAGIHPLLVGAAEMPTMMEVTSWQLLKEIEPITELMPGLPRALWRALELGLRKERDQRIESASELAIQLRAVLDAMARARGATGRVRMMTVAAVRSTRPELFAPATTDARTRTAALRPAAGVAPLTEKGTLVIDTSAWDHEAAVAADPQMAAAYAAALDAVPPGPVAVPEARPRDRKAGASRPRWVLPTAAAVAFAAALAVTLWLGSQSGTTTGQPSDEAQAEAAAPRGTGASSAPNGSAQRSPEVAPDRARPEAGPGSPEEASREASRSGASTAPGRAAEGVSSTDDPPATASAGESQPGRAPPPAAPQRPAPASSAPARAGPTTTQASQPAGKPAPKPLFE